MQRSPFSRLIALTLAAVASVTATVASLWHLGTTALHAAVMALPAPQPGPLQATANEPEGTARQRTWLIPANAHMARMDARPRIAIEPGWRMCPST
jgi:hypothetical protein